MTTTPDDPSFLPAHEWLRGLRRRRWSSLELLEHCLGRVAGLNPSINALPVIDADRARDAARAADQALARGDDLGTLHGLPMTVKESFNVAGLPTTYGYEHRRGHRADTDAVAVQRLRAAGAIVFGKSNVPVSLADWQSFNPVYGTTNNPWDLTRTPGGSSGGSAAALAAGMTGLELGSDIGASIRNPAHYCGVWGHKPTWGVVPLAGHGLEPRASVDSFDISAAGPLARSAHDLSLAMDVLATPMRAMTPLGPVPMAWRVRGTPPRRCRVAVLFDDAEAEVDVQVQQALRDLVHHLRAQGVPVTEDARPVDSAEAHDVYLHLLRAATGAFYDDATHLALVDRARAFSRADQHYEARHVHGSTLRHRDWVQLDERRAQLRIQWQRFFERFDVLICPTATTVAFKHAQQGERWQRMIPVNGHSQPSTDSLFWAGYPGIVGLPATAVPLGLSAGGLPIGAQIIGPAFGDPDVLRFAQWLEDTYRGFVPPNLKAQGLS